MAITQIGEVLGKKQGEPLGSSTLGAGNWSEKKSLGLKWVITNRYLMATPYLKTDFVLNTSFAYQSCSIMENNVSFEKNIVDFSCKITKKSGLKLKNSGSIKKK